MFQLLVLFILLQLAILFRYIIFDAFNPITYFSIYLLLIAALAVYIMGKYFAMKESAYEPKQISSWSYYNRQNIFPVEKPLFKGEINRGTIQRKFLKKWHYIIADIFGFRFFGINH